MSAYFDTSALIRAWRLGIQPKGVTRPHSLAEFYCVLTGPGLAVEENGRTVKIHFSPADTVVAAQETFANVSFCHDKGGPTLAALERAAKANITGRLIHDWLHCHAAEGAGARQIITLNLKDFSRLTKIKLVAPVDFFAA